MLDKKIKRALVICAVLFIVFTLLSFVDLGDGREKTDEEDLEQIICDLEGIDNASVIYHYENDGKQDRVSGVAVIYEGSDDAAVKRRIYELVNSLYDLPYNRIFVSH